MSTKIYTAWRFPIDRVHEFTGRLHRYQQSKALEQFCLIPGRVKSSIIDSIYIAGGWNATLSKEEFLKEKNAEIRARMALRVCWLAGLAKERNLFYDIACGFVMYPYNDWYYVLPEGEAKWSHKFKIPKWAEDFRYWNNSDDLPSGVTPSQWDKRGRLWDKVINEEVALAHTTIDLTRRIGQFFLFDAFLSHDKSVEMRTPSGYDDKQADLETIGAIIEL